ncbi:variable surface lipoprotein [Mycoplasmopsis bovis]
MKKSKFLLLGSVASLASIPFKSSKMSNEERNLKLINQSLVKH